jgi:hypothetical protein
MMRALLGSAIGGAVAGAVALVATAPGRAPEPAWSPHSAAAPYVQTASGAQGPNTLAGSAPVLVPCEPHQEAVLQRAWVAGREVAQVICVARQQTPPMPYAAAPYAAPVGYTQAVAYGQPDIVERPAVRTVQTRRVVREAAPKRSWQKTALVIGGSAGAGAGVGAIAGGKKGALIGAAVGGGAASIYEAVKRR